MLTIAVTALIGIVVLLFQRVYIIGNSRLKPCLLDVTVTRLFAFACMHCYHIYFVQEILRMFRIKKKCSVYVHNNKNADSCSIIVTVNFQSVQSTI